MQRLYGWSTLSIDSSSSLYPKESVKNKVHDAVIDFFRYRFRSRTSDIRKCTVAHFINESEVKHEMHAILICLFFSKQMHAKFMVSQVLILIQTLLIHGQYLCELTNDPQIMFLNGRL